MDEKIQKYLYDVLNAVDEINGYFEGHPKLFEVFNLDLMLRRAVERNVEIMGEVELNIHTISNKQRSTAADEKWNSKIDSETI